MTEPTFWVRKDIREAVTDVLRKAHASSNEVRVVDENEALELHAANGAQGLFPVIIDPALCTDRTVMESLDAERTAGARIVALSSHGHTDSLSVLKEYVASVPGSQRGILRLRYRSCEEGSGRHLRDFVNALYMVAHIFGAGARIRCVTVEEQRIAIVRMRRGTLVHLDCATVQSRSIAYTWEYASKGILLEGNDAPGQILDVESKDMDSVSHSWWLDDAVARALGAWTTVSEPVSDGTALADAARTWLAAEKSAAAGEVVTI